MSYRYRVFLFLIFSFLINIFCISAQEETKYSLIQEGQYTLEELLSLYLENDLELQKLTIDVEKSELDLKKTKITQGFDVTLSTGTMTFYSSPNSSVITVKPSAKATFPVAKNLAVNFSTDYQYKTATKTNTLQDTKISSGIDVLSKNDSLSKIEILKSERLLLEAKRKLQPTALSTEKKFYNELKEILNIANKIYTLLQDVYIDKLNLEKLKAQGYSPTSSTYRIAEMKVTSGEHDIETGFHNLKKNVVVFYNRCGINIDTVNDESFFNFIPSKIPEVQSLKFTDFEKSNYLAIEKANWIYYINELTRKADKYFTLGVNAGYTFNNSTTKTDTVDTGVSTTVGGITVNAGVSVPVDNQKLNPAFNLSATVSPTTFLTKNITKQQYELTKKQELIDIKTAEHEYDTAIISFDQTLANLDWEKESIKENFILYQKTEEDLLKYYKMGIIKESEWLSARNNRQLYEVKTILNKLEFILYNNNVMSQFVDLDNATLKTGEIDESK